MQTTLSRNRSPILLFASLIMPDKAVIVSHEDELVVLFNV